MGWTTRGTGRNYDSLTGSAALVGFFTKKVLTYISKNRKCRKCDRGHDSSDHDCRLNFEGSAKAMESAAAAHLATQNSIFDTCHVQLGIMIGDNDSSAIGSVRAASHHEVIKHSDKNHTSKGVVNELYKIKKNHKELTAGAIKYLQHCFNYCVAQNIGDPVEMGKGIRNIPSHCFNNHDNCGTWCGYHANPESYRHSAIGDGFVSEQLFDALRCIFDVVASRADRFAGVSSNVNESLNATIASKAPKMRFYGSTASSDARLACAINKKNSGEQYVHKMAEKLSLSPAKYTETYGLKVDLNASKRYLRSCSQEFKKRRLFLKAKKTDLQHKKERSEGSQTY
ncbi:uncharacterized protein LOC124292970 [Neodiprion lecontei]|uniref:Uncharacterized protein LOC124292970 n=1 Tax=Neodiprion lecontei TaxID=441921 RepID=A0ABM3FIG8_NEOLC|nr:uncharacterized protein LOC124292970 [Neodiprion lecontei]